MLPVFTSSDFAHLSYPREFIPAVTSFSLQIDCYPEDYKARLIKKLTISFEKIARSTPSTPEEWTVLEKAFSIIAIHLSNPKSKERDYDKATKFVWLIQNIAGKTLEHIPEQIVPKVVVLQDHSLSLLPNNRVNDFHLETHFKTKNKLWDLSQDTVWDISKFKDPRSQHALVSYLEDKDFIPFVDMMNIEEIMEFCFLNKIEKFLEALSRYAAKIINEGFEKPAKHNPISLFKDIFWPMYQRHKIEETFPLLHILKAYAFHPKSGCIVGNSPTLATLDVFHELFFSYLYRLKDTQDNDLKLSKEECLLVEKLETEYLSVIKSTLEEIKEKQTEAKNIGLTHLLIKDHLFPIHSRRGFGSHDSDFNAYARLNKLTQHFFKINNPEFFEEKRPIHLVSKDHKKLTLQVNETENALVDIELLDAYGMMHDLGAFIFSFYPIYENELKRCQAALESLQSIYTRNKEERNVLLEALCRGVKQEEIVKIMDKLVRELYSIAGEHKYVNYEIFIIYTN